MGHFGILEWMHLYFTMMSSSSSSEKLVTIRILDNMEKADSHGMHSLGSIWELVSNRHIDEGMQKPPSSRHKNSARIKPKTKTTRI